MIITLDLSLNSSCLLINDEKHIFCSKHIAMGKKGLTKWFDLVKDEVILHIHENLLLDTENDKMNNYFHISNEILNVIKNYLIEHKIHKDDIHFGMESYSFSSNAGPIIDLVTFGTLIRRHIFEILNSNQIHLIPPKTLKMETAKMVYEPSYKGKKIEYRNNDGVSGGSFTKMHMLQSIIDHKDKIGNDSWVNFLLMNENLIKEISDVKKPIEDINDAFLLKLYLNKKGLF